MAIRWEDIQNLSVTEGEINLLAGLTVNAASLNGLDGYTGTAGDLNAAITAPGNLTAHEALDFTTAHPIAANSLDGLIITDATITEGKLAFSVATQVELDAAQVQIDNIVSDNVVQQGQIDNLYAIVIPGQGSDLADAIQQTVDHIDNVSNAHDASAISYGNNYVLPLDIPATSTSLVLSAGIIKHFRVGETIRFQDDITPTEDLVLLTVDYNTYTITFAATTNSYTTANNGIIWVLSEDNVQEGVDRSLRNNTDVFTGRLTVDQSGADEALVINKSTAGDVLSLSGQAGSDELVMTQGTIRSTEGYNLDLADTKTFVIENDTAGEVFKVDENGDAYVTQVKMRDTGSGFTGTITKETLTADRTWTLRDEDLVVGNPSLTGNALKYLRTNAGTTDTEWVFISAPEVTYDNTTSGLVSVNVKAALDEVDGNLDTHIADASIHFTEASISHLNIGDIGTNSHAAIDLHISDGSIHRIINDTGTSLTELWSANKINSELATKADASHNHTLDSLSNVDNTGILAGSILEWNGTTDWIIGTKGEINTVSNLVGDEGIFAAKVGSDLQLKSLTAGSNISLVSDGNTITISTAGAAGEINTASNVGGANGIFKQKTGVDLEFKTLAAGTNTTITPVGDTLVIASTGGGGGGGTSITRSQVAHGFTLLNGIYHDGTIWQKAQANDAETLAEYVVTEVTDANNFIAFKFGEATVTAHGKTVGEHYYLSDSSPGQSQIIEPNDFSSPLFYVEDANTVHIEVYRPSEVTEVIGDQIDYQTKILSADVTTDITISDLTFNNLEIGKKYRMTLQARVVAASGDFIGVRVYENLNQIAKISQTAQGAGTSEFTATTSAVFTATGTTVTFDTQSVGVGSRIGGGGSIDQTWAQLEELPVHQATTKWN